MISTTGSYGPTYSTTIRPIYNRPINGFQTPYPTFPSYPTSTGFPILSSTPPPYYNPSAAGFGFSSTTQSPISSTPFQGPSGFGGFPSTTTSPFFTSSSPYNPSPSGISYSTTSRPFLNDQPTRPTVSAYPTSTPIPFTHPTDPSTVLITPAPKTYINGSPVRHQYQSIFPNRYLQPPQLVSAVDYPQYPFGQNDFDESNELPRPFRPHALRAQHVQPLAQTFAGIPPSAFDRVIRRY